ncbi:MAG: hypothetical protein RLZZ117_1085 [Cyanobacteriota bacterium]
MNTFPPEDIRSFLQLCSGEWLTLRSLLDAEPVGMKESKEGSGEDLEESQSWHQAERGELKVEFLENDEAGMCGGMEVELPNGSRVQLNFRSDGSVVLACGLGQWQLTEDGTLELRMEQGGRLVKERIWFSKPNLRLRCTLEQGTDGSPGRASFSSEIRRVPRPVESIRPVLA